jgi:hypothetical protein
MMISRTKIIVIIIPLYGILLYSRTRIVDYNDQPTVVFGTLQGIFTETNGLQFSQVGIIIFLVLVFSFPPGVTFSLISEGECVVLTAHILTCLVQNMVASGINLLSIPKINYNFCYYSICPLLCFSDNFVLIQLANKE